MPVHNADIAAVFQDIADLLSLQEASPFRIRAYQNASRIVGGLQIDLAQLVGKGEPLPKLPGIGADLAAKIAEIAATGTCALHKSLKKELPPAMVELLKVPGLGPARVRALYEHLRVRSLDQLLRAARSGRIREVHGFGEKTEAHILDALEAHSGSAHRFKLAVAAQYANALREALCKAYGVGRVVVAGSFRRMRETVGDIDIVATAAPRSDVMKRFVEYPEVREVIAHGETRSSVLLRCGIQVDLRVVPEESYGAALHYFTGSKAHNIAIRRLAQERGLKLNEYGIFQDEKRVAGETEESVFAAVALPFIAPELRENSGEIEAARNGTLPHLVTLSDLRGDLHCHSKASDGRHSVKEMALAARERGLRYVAITEHSSRLAVARGLDPARLAEQMKDIDELNRALEGIVVLRGIEVDILPDGALDLPDSVLSRLDLVVIAVHSQLELSRARQTERILRAMDSPCAHILAHPTGRLIDRRAPCDVDMPQIIRKAKSCGIALELNANPERLDLIDTHCRMARDEGVLVAVSSDAHSIHDFDNLQFGIGQARRGWLERSDVLNTRSLDELRRILRRGSRSGPGQRAAERVKA